jgi:hypothetical protein
VYRCQKTAIADRQSRLRSSVMLTRTDNGHTK